MLVVILSILKNNFLILYETDVTKIREIVNDKLVLAFFKYRGCNLFI